MQRNSRTFWLLIGFGLSFAAALVITFYLCRYEYEELVNTSLYTPLIIVIVCLIFLATFFICRLLKPFLPIKLYRSDSATNEIAGQHEAIDERALAMDKLLKYSKKRDEIDEEIRYLSRQLAESGIEYYADINRLAFSGQNNSSITNSISYDAFISRFGLDKRDMAVRKGTAAFLTPFTREGDELFYHCQSILGRIDLFVRRTDNFVKKDDILMNIVSLIIQSEFILVNIDDRNPNVFYELGIAHAIGKPTILLSRSKLNFEKFEFDVQGKSIVIYDDYATLELKLLRQINMLKAQMAIDRTNALD